MTTTDIPGITTTVTVTSEVTDYAALGRHIAEASSVDQADFLGGFACGFQEFGNGGDRVPGLMQVEYIREAVETHNERAAIRWLVEELHVRINAGAVAS